MARAFRDVLGGSPTEAAQGLLEIARNGKRDADRIAAWKELLDRGWGKAPAFASIEGAEPLGMGEVDTEIHRIAEQLRQERPQAGSIRLDAYPCCGPNASCAEPARGTAEGVQ